jgi:hypothetical protein
MMQGGERVSISKLWKWFTSPEDPEDKAMNVVKRVGALLPIIAAIGGAIS